MRLVYKVSVCSDDFCCLNYAKYPKSNLSENLKFGKKIRYYTRVAICVIPARGNSKRLPGKNLLNFRGKPLVQIAAETAIASGSFSKVVISSEDPKVLSAVKDIAGVTLSVRPEKLSDDNVRADEIVRWEISQLSLGLEMVYCCLFPTTPFLTPELLAEAAQKYSGGVLFGVIPNSESPYRSFEVISGSNDLRALFPERLTGQSQDYPKTVVDAGQFYLAQAGVWNQYASITACPEARGFLLNPELAIDINNPSDWQKLIQNS